MLKESDVHNVIKLICFLLCLCTIFFLLNYYLYNDNTYTRVMMHELYDQEKIDFVFAGASSAYRHYNPKIWDDELDISSFNAGSSNQRPEGTYYLLRDILDNYSPQYVIYSISPAMFIQFDNWDISTKDYIIFDFMPLTLNKLQYGLNVFSSDIVSGFIEFTRNRNLNIISTFNSVKDVKGRKEYKDYDYSVYDGSEEKLNPKGYVSREKHFSEDEVGELNVIQFTDYHIRDLDIKYMRKIANLCEENGCELIIVVPPMHYGSMANYYDYQEVVDFNRNIADSIGAPIFDFSLAKHDFLSMKDSYYYDWAHMSGNGADYFSSVCSEFIRRYISGEEINNDDYFYKSYQDLLEDTPWIYNAWIVKDEKGYQAFCNHGNDVTPLYSFWGSEDNGDTWELIEDYSSSDTVSFDDVDEGYNMLMVKAKDVNSKSEYDQLCRMTLE